MKINILKNETFHTFHTAYDKAKCKEIIGVCTLKGVEHGLNLHIEKDPSGTAQMEHDRKTVGTLRGDRVVSVLLDDRIKLYSMRSLPGDGYWGSQVPRFKWVLHFAGELQSSSEGTVIQGRIIRMPKMLYLLFLLYLIPVCCFAFLGIFGLIVKVAFWVLNDPSENMIYELKIFILFLIPLLVAVLFLILGYSRDRRHIQDIFDIFQVELKATLRS